MRTFHIRQRLASGLVLGLLAVIPLPSLAQTSTLIGQAVTLGARGQVFSVPGTNVTLTSVEATVTEAPAPATVSADRYGRFKFPETADGCYILEAETQNLQGHSDVFCVPLPEGQELRLEMGPKVFVESIDVTATAIAIDPTETSSTGAVGVTALYDAPKINKRYDDVMPFIPGVFKGPSGEVSMNGTRPTQSGGQFNGVDITDPVIGASPFAVPLDTVSNVQVLSNPYDAQYGGFAGAVSTVETKPANMSELKVALQDFVPRARLREGNFVGVEAFAPRFTLTGPIRKGKVAFLHSTEYHFIRIPQDDANLGQLERDIERESLTVYNQFDIRHTERNSSTIGFLVYPAKVNHFGLDAFSLQESTPDLRRRGYMLTYRNRNDFKSGAALLTQFSYQKLGKDVKPRGFDPYVRGLDRARGSFFNRETRASDRWNWSEQYEFGPVERRGSHLPRVGFHFAHESYNGTQTFNPILWLGASDNPVMRADFGAPADLRSSKQEYAGFVQDKWTVFPSLTLDLGARVERDSIVSRTNPSFRSGFAYSFGKNTRTVLRGGAGLFMGRATLAVSTFPFLPARTETRFGTNGEVVSRLAFENRLGGRIRNSRTLGWNLQLDREMVHNLFLRLGYQQRRTTDNFIINRDEGVALPGGGEPANYFTLLSHGRDHYKEWQFTLRYVLPRNGHLTGSYVRSSSIGDLNDLGSIYGPTPAELIRANQRVPLAFDAPNRFILWSEFQLPLNTRAIPFYEARDGFPYSALDEFRDYVGPANRAGRFRTYHSLDLQVIKVFTIKFRGKKRRVRFGVRMFNVFNTFNPQDVQNNLASPYYGSSYRGVKRRVRFLFGFGN